MYMHLLVLTYEGEPYWEVFTSKSDFVGTTEAIKRIDNLFKYEMNMDKDARLDVMNNCEWRINRIDKVDNYKIELKKVK